MRSDDEERPDDQERPRVNVGGARNIARRLLKDAKIKDIPVSLWKVIEYLKARHNLEVLRHGFAKIDGLLVAIGDGPPTIGFNPDRSWVRRRFTLGHEIGHLLLGHACGADLDGVAEREADQFAAELLVPLAMIRKDFKERPDLDELAKKYIVSKEVLCRHLMECHII